MQMFRIVIATIVMVAILALLTFVLRMLFKVPLWFVSSMSGWRDLSEDFPSQNYSDYSLVLRFCSLRIRGIDYRSCVTVLVAPEHITLRILAPFRDFHPDISIPISHLQFTSRSTYWFDEFSISDSGNSIWFDHRVSNFIKSICRNAKRIRQA
jgi:hypothetical protein